jgi:glycosyltransferase involved in cell wall biosynthesis
MSNDSFPKLTACLLVYNHAHLIGDVIKDILGQSYSDFDLIISDDCSTDNSYEIAKSFERIDKRVRVIKTPNNLGMAGNTNFCVGNINSTYIALLHHDDILRNTLFEKWLSAASKSDNISFVFNDYLVNNLPSHLIERRNFSECLKGENFLKNVLLKAWGCPVRGTALIRNKYFKEIGGMDQKYGLLSDVDLWMRLSAKWDVGYVNEPLIEVRQSRPENYPRDYSEFSWYRINLLHEIHADNIIRNNYPKYLHLFFKRFLFRNRVSFEIIKWHLYAVMRKKYFIINSYSYNSNKFETFYSSLIRKIILLFVKER